MKKCVIVLLIACICLIGLATYTIVKNVDQDNYVNEVEMTAKKNNEDLSNKLTELVNKTREELENEYDQKVSELDEAVKALKASTDTMNESLSNRINLLSESLDMTKQELNEKITNLKNSTGEEDQKIADFVAELSESTSEADQNLAKQIVALQTSTSAEDQSISQTIYKMSTESASSNEDLAKALRNEITTLTNSFNELKKDLTEKVEKADELLQNNINELANKCNECCEDIQKKISEINDEIAEINADTDAIKQNIADIEQAMEDFNGEVVQDVKANAVASLTKSYMDFKTVDIPAVEQLIENLKPVTAEEQAYFDEALKTLNTKYSYEIKFIYEKGWAYIILGKTADIAEAQRDEYELRIKNYLLEVQLAIYKIEAQREINKLVNISDEIKDIFNKTGLEDEINLIDIPSITSIIYDPDSVLDENRKAQDEVDYYNELIAKIDLIKYAANSYNQLVTDKINYLQDITDLQTGLYDECANVSLTKTLVDYSSIQGVINDNADWSTDTNSFAQKITLVFNNINATTADIDTIYYNKAGKIYLAFRGALAYNDLADYANQIYEQEHDIYKELTGDELTTFHSDIVANTMAMDIYFDNLKPIIDNFTSSSLKADYDTNTNAADLLIRKDSDKTGIYYTVYVLLYNLDKLDDLMNTVYDAFNNSSSTISINSTFVDLYGNSYVEPFYKDQYGVFNYNYFRALTNTDEGTTIVNKTYTTIDTLFENTATGYSKTLVTNVEKIAADEQIYYNMKLSGNSSIDKEIARARSLNYTGTVYEKQYLIDSPIYGLDDGNIGRQADGLNCVDEYAYYKWLLNDVSTGSFSRYDFDKQCILEKYSTYLVDENGTHTINVNNVKDLLTSAAKASDNLEDTFYSNKEIIVKAMNTHIKTREAMLLINPLIIEYGNLFIDSFESEHPECSLDLVINDVELENYKTKLNNTLTGVSTYRELIYKLIDICVYDYSDLPLEDMTNDSITMEEAMQHMKSFIDLLDAPIDIWYRLTRLGVWMSDDTDNENIECLFIMNNIIAANE